MTVCAAVTVNLPPCVVARGCTYIACVSLLRDGCYGAQGTPDHDGLLLCTWWYGSHDKFCYDHSHLPDVLYHLCRTAIVCLGLLRGGCNGTMGISDDDMRFTSTWRSGVHCTFCRGHLIIMMCNVQVHGGLVYITDFASVVEVFNPVNNNLDQFQQPWDYAVQVSQPAKRKTPGP